MAERHGSQLPSDTAHPETVTTNSPEKSWGPARKCVDAHVNACVCEQGRRTRLIKQHSAILASAAQVSTNFLGLSGAGSGARQDMCIRPRNDVLQQTHLF